MYDFYVLSHDSNYKWVWISNWIYWTLSHLIYK
jgi:hypothetical protein